MTLFTPFLLMSFPLNSLFPHILSHIIEKTVSRHREYLSPQPNFGMVKMHVTFQEDVTIYN